MKSAPDSPADGTAGVTWPKRGPDFNRWNSDVARFAALVQSQPLLWLRNSQLKYLNLRIDMG